jgi:hypothetical protein
LAGHWSDLPVGSFSGSGTNISTTVLTMRNRGSLIEHEISHLALSVRQPWAWALFYAGKDLENRNWCPTNPGLKQRGWIAIHASKGMTKADYQEAAAYMRDRPGIICPGPQDLRRGGIFGIVDLVTKSDSPWFFGPYALMLRDARPCSFRPASGLLGFFNWERS